MPYRTFFGSTLFAFVILTTSACQSTPYPQAGPVLPAAQGATPEALLARAEAATPEDAAALRIAAAQAFMDAARVPEAQAALAPIYTFAPATLSVETQDALSRVTARIAITQGDGQTAPGVA